MLAAGLSLLVILTIIVITSAYKTLVSALCSGCGEWFCLCGKSKARKKRASPPPSLSFHSSVSGMSSQTATPIPSHRAFQESCTVDEGGAEGGMEEIELDAVRVERVERVETLQSGENMWRLKQS